jgi:hypothetical protein
LAGVISRVVVVVVGERESAPRTPPGQGGGPGLEGQAGMPGSVQLDPRVVRLFTEVRRELGVPRSRDVLSERAFFEKIPPAAAID